jgi:hypothetical protein
MTKLAAPRPKTEGRETVLRTRPEIWEEAKKEAIAQLGGKFSARAMQRAVQIYKARGGGYKSPKPPTYRNALARWTEERWTYAGKKKQSRYLPAFVIARLTPGQRRRTNAAKKHGDAQWTRQPEDVARLAADLKQRYWQNVAAAETKRSGRPRAEWSSCRAEPGPRAPQGRGRGAARGWDTIQPGRGEGGGGGRRGETKAVARQGNEAAAAFGARSASTESSTKQGIMGMKDVFAAAFAELAELKRESAIEPETEQRKTRNPKRRA